MVLDRPEPGSRSSGEDSPDGPSDVIPLNPMVAGGVSGFWTAPAALLVLGVLEVREWVSDDGAGLLCTVLASVLLGPIGGGFGALYAVSFNHTREWNLPVGWAAFGGAFVGGAVLSAGLALALLIWNLSQ